MAKEQDIKQTTADKVASKTLTPAAQRALDEAAQRHKQAQQQEQRKKEMGGRGGQDPARYGDWEIKGRAIDF